MSVYSISFIAYDYVCVYSSRLIKLVVNVALAIHWMACVWFLIADLTPKDLVVSYCYAMFLIAKLLQRYCNAVFYVFVCSRISLFNFVTLKIFQLIAAWKRSIFYVRELSKYCRDTYNVFHSYKNMQLAGKKLSWFAMKCGSPICQLILFHFFEWKCVYRFVGGWTIFDFVVFCRNFGPLLAYGFFFSHSEAV